jgi:alkanesulfonate monooxygenase SsuD/methylene tetrahydromethanopterin reductase-like flavin-dependent oxidoreductase (luciferase family)
VSGEVHAFSQLTDGQAVSGSGPAVGLMLSTLVDPDTGRLDPERVLEAAVGAEESGFDGVYVGDHLLHPHPMLESVVTLSIVASSTRRVSFGPCVMLLALRDPLVLAKQLGTLSAFAPGRLRVGVGVGGEYPEEFEAAAVPLAERGRRMESALRQVRSLASTGVDRPGGTLEPLAGGVPFLLAGRREVSLRRAASLGDGWIGYLLSVDGFSRRKAFLTRCLEERRRPVDVFSTGMLVPVHLAGRDGPAAAAEAWARLTGAKVALPEQLFVAGEADRIVAQLHDYWTAGCTEFVLAPADQGRGYLSRMEQLARDVLPQVKAFS